MWRQEGSFSIEQETGGWREYLQRKGVHVSSEGEDGFLSGPDEAHNPSLGDGPLVVDPERIQLSPDELTRPVLLEPQLGVLVDPSPDPLHPLEELRLLCRRQKLLGHPPELLLRFRRTQCLLRESRQQQQRQERSDRHGRRGIGGLRGKCVEVRCIYGEGGGGTEAIKE